MELADKARIQDPFYDHVIGMYRKRGLFWQRVSIVLLVLTVLFVLAGIYFFYEGDSQTRMQAQSEVNLQTEIRERDREIEDLVNESGRVEARVQTLESAKFIASRLGDLAGILAGGQADNLLGALPLLRFGQAASENVSNVQRASKESQPEQAILVALPADDFGGNSQTFRWTDYEELASHGTGVNWSEIQETLATMVDRLQGVDDPTQVTEETKVFLKSQAKKAINAGAKEFAVMKPIVVQKAEEAATAAHNLRSNWNAREEKLRTLRKKRTELETELNEVKADRNYVLFMAWVPDLTIRVGSVILLLFITKIFLATYRYTIALSSFYIGIADAVQLLQPGGDGLWYDIEHLSTLLGRLTPTSLAVDAVASPADQLSGLAQSWIAKKMP